MRLLLLFKLHSFLLLFLARASRVCPFCQFSFSVSKEPRVPFPRCFHGGEKPIKNAVIPLCASIEESDVDSTAPKGRAAVLKKSQDNNVNTSKQPQPPASAGVSGGGISKGTLTWIKNGINLYRALDSRQVEDEDSDDAEKESGAKSTHQHKLDAFNSRAKRTRHVLLKKIALWAFETTTQDEVSNLDNCRVAHEDFYSGMLLVHLHLAKFVGVAACAPPTRQQAEELFALADADDSGYLDKEEFTNAVVVACAPITSRVVVFWAILAVLPHIVSNIMNWFFQLIRNCMDHVPETLYGKTWEVLEWVIEDSVALAIFTIILPYIFNKIDCLWREQAQERARQRFWWLGEPWQWGPDVSGVRKSPNDAKNTRKHNIDMESTECTNNRFPPGAYPSNEEAAGTDDSKSH